MAERLQITDGTPVRFHLNPNAADGEGYVDVYIDNGVLVVRDPQKLQIYPWSANSVHIEQRR